MLIKTFTIIIKLAFQKETSAHNVMQILATLKLFSLAFPPVPTRRKPNDGIFE